MATRVSTIINLVDCIRTCLKGCSPALELIANGHIREEPDGLYAEIRAYLTSLFVLEGFEQISSDEKTALTLMVKGVMKGWSWNDPINKLLEKVAVKYELGNY